MKKFKDNPTMPIKKFWETWEGNNLDEEGNSLSTWNKNSFWDWFVIGGRWDGILTDNLQKGDMSESLENNNIKCS